MFCAMFNGLYEFRMRSPLIFKEVHALGFSIIPFIGLNSNIYESEITVN